MNIRRAIVLLLPVLLAGAYFEATAQKALEVMVTIPASPRATIAPVRISLPAQLAVRKEYKIGWQARDGSTPLPTQIEDAAGRILLVSIPVAASGKESRKTIQLVMAPKPAGLPFQFQEAEGKSLRLTEGKAPVFTYNFGMMLKPGVAEDRRRSSYIHPMYSPDGTVLTDDFPEDHYHHRGVSWMWPVILAGGEKYSLWDIRGIQQRFERWSARETGPVFAKLGVENGWYAGEKKLAKETVELIAFRAAPDGRAVDVTLTFEAIGRPVSISGTPDQEKGYGGFCLRFAPRAETWIATETGLQEKDTDRVPFPWADLSARFREGERTSGAAIFIDSRNPGFPNGWTLRKYGFLGVAWPGLQSVTLEPGRPVTLRYRLWLHSGDVETGGVASQYRHYLNPPSAQLALK